MEISFELNKIKLVKGIDEIKTPKDQKKKKRMTHAKHETSTEID